jgi:hypothetical protein
MRLLGRILVDAAGEFAKTEPPYRKLLEQSREEAGASDSLTAAPMALLGWNLLQQKKWTDAEPLLRECLRIREQAQPEFWTTFNARSMLGACLLGQRKFAEAEPLLVSGYERMKQLESQIPAAGKVRLTEAGQRLVELYESWGKPKRAAMWQKTLNEVNQLAPPAEKTSKTPRYS